MSAVVEALQKGKVTGDCTLAAVLDGPEAGSRMLLRGGYPVWQTHSSGILQRSLSRLQECTATGFLELDGTRVFVERFGAVPQIVVCGGGHVGASVVRLAKLLGLPVCALEDRPEFAGQLRQAGADALRTADRIVLTFGTAWVYKLKSSGKVVSNCHRLPEKMFDRQLLTVGEIVAEWKSLLLSLWKQNPELKILFTVSPIRHWKDGAHGNQLSKATLLLAIDALQKEFPEHTAYFPAYEIMMDELREYRFYADDMLHPSTTAIEYIWERFTGSMLSPDSLSILKEWKDIQKAINHKPFQPESEAYKRFISQTLLKMERLNEKFPYFDMTNEVEMIKKKF